MIAYVEETTQAVKTNQLYGSKQAFAQIVYEISQKRFQPLLLHNNNTTRFVPACRVDRAFLVTDEPRIPSMLSSN